MIKFDNNMAFSLLEVLLASVIFVITVGGAFVTLNAVRVPVANKENALTAAVFGKQVLETLRSQVNAGTYYNACTVPNGDGSCGDFSLFVGPHEVAQAPLTAAGLTWPATLIASNPGTCSANPCLSYTVTCADGSNPCNADSARGVNLNIQWPDVT